MAIYKGREVTLLGPSTGEDVSPMYDIQEQSGQRASVKFSTLQLTEKEKTDLDKQGALHVKNANVIKDKDLQDLRDSQNPKKIEDSRKKNPANDQPVKAPTYVKPSEVKTA